jgi:FeS assembly SUF system protein
MTDETPDEQTENAHGNTPEGGDAPATGPDAIREQAIAAIKTCYDPEIPVNIYELGLIYDVTVNDNGDVNISMTLTSPHCPVAESLPRDVESRVSAVDGVASATVEITWDPPWTPDMMSEAARLELNL